MDFLKIKDIVKQKYKESLVFLLEFLMKYGIGQQVRENLILKVFEEHQMEKRLVVKVSKEN